MKLSEYTSHDTIGLAKRVADREVTPGELAVSSKVNDLLPTWISSRTRALSCARVTCHESGQFPLSRVRDFCPLFPGCKTLLVAMVSEGK